MLSASESIKLFLESVRNEHNQDLINRVLEHGVGLELQVNVSPTGGEPVAGTNSTFTDGVNRWHSFRIPKGSYSDPHWKDYKLSFPLDKYVDAIGTTGWHWQRKESLWVAYDIDSILGHAEGVGISDLELARVREAVAALDYVEVRRSTGGKGLHLYVFLPPGVKTTNHSEHAAIARAILSKMSEEVGFDLSVSIDVCGSNTWIWARRATVENQGFAIVKPAKMDYPHSLAGWKDHLPVVRRTRERVSIGVEPEEEDVFTELASAHQRIPLDERHVAVRDALLAMRGTAVWVQDHYLLQTHTYMLKQLMDDPSLDIQGVFETNSRGSDLNTPNCFMFPLRDGAWRVTRFGLGTVEHPTWTQDGKSWTWCHFNQKSSLRASAIAGGGTANSKGGYEFEKLSDATKALEAGVASGVKIVVPEKLSTRQAVVRTGKDGKIVIEVPKTQEDGATIPGWASADKKGWWTQTLQVADDPQVDAKQNGVGDFDKLVRCLETMSNQPAGWVVTKNNGGWTRKAPSAVKTVLQAVGNAKPEAECIMGAAELRPWKLVTIPFAPEYPGDRQWNLDAPQLAVTPAPPSDDETSKHPHWDMLLNHIGGSLTKSLRKEAWAQEDGVIDGRTYLMCWYANVLRHPFSPLPYLFLYGPENTGKSMFHEAFSLLVSSGVVKADRALTTDWNGELEGCILAVVEEKDIALSKGVHERLKDAVTAERLSIRRMRTDVYQVRNTTHWVQCSNKIEACPIFNGDSRITVCLVPEIEHEIPKDRLRSMLVEEMPHFLSTLMNMRLPPPRGRLRLPIVTTDEKIAIIAGNQTPIEAFIEEHCEVQKGHSMLFKEFYEALVESGAEDISKPKVSRELCGMRGIKLRNGQANKRYILGLKLKETKKS